MKQFFLNLKIKYKLLSAFVLVSVILLLVGFNQFFLIQSQSNQQADVLRLVKTGEFILESKYFIQVDVHILHELIGSSELEGFESWWEKHLLLVQDIKNEVSKLEKIAKSNDNEYLALTKFGFDTGMQIEDRYRTMIIPDFEKIYAYKLQELQIQQELNLLSQVMDFDHIIEKKELLRNSLKSIKNQLNRQAQIIIANSLSLIDSVNDSFAEKKTKIEELEDKNRFLSQFSLLETIGLLLASLIISLGIGYYIGNDISKRIQEIVGFSSQVAQGKLPEKVSIKSKDEVALIAEGINLFTSSLRRTAEFSEKIRNGEFDSEFIPLSEHDILGNSLLEMRTNFQKAKKDEEKRLLEAEKRSWTSDAQSQIGELLRRYSHDIQQLADEVIIQLVKLLKAEHGALFFLHGKGSESYLELQTAYAYERKKYFSKKIYLGEGLLGACAKEKEKIYLNNVPDGYTEIKSGLGNATPQVLLLLPLLFENQVLGVIEIASFEEISSEKIEFADAISKSIATTISTSRVNEQTVQLLAQSQEQSKELTNKEQELRQHLEKLQNIQAESEWREFELKQLSDALESFTYTVEYDMNGIITDISPSFAKLLNLPRLEIINREHKAGISFNKESLASYEQFWNDLKQGIKKTQTNKFVIKNNFIWMYENYIPMADRAGNYYKVLKIAINITENQEQKLKIKELEKELESLRKK